MLNKPMPVSGAVVRQQGQFISANTHKPMFLYPFVNISLDLNVRLTSLLLKSLLSHFTPAVLKLYQRVSYLANIGGSIPPFAIHDYKKEVK